MKIRYYDVLIVGAGQAGAQTAISLRQHGYTGTIGLIGNELELPYERPALSKDYLSGERPFDALLLRRSEFWKEQDISLHLGVEVVSVDAEESEVRGRDGEKFVYRRLVWATGGRARKLTCPGNSFCGSYTIRSRADVDGLRRELQVARRIIVIGGGYLGLEAAATLNTLGKEVVVIEAADRVLARMTAEDVSRFLEAEHRARGVDFRLSSSVLRIVGDAGRANGVELADGERIAGDLIIVAIGIDVAAAPLLRAGATGANGVLVDASCRTTLPNIYAVGDCTECAQSHLGGAVIRIESIQNANDQADVAARAIMGKEAIYDAVPWFWSNQYDLKIQSIGLSKLHDAVVIRGDREKRSFTAIYLNRRRVVAMDCINATKDFVQGRTIVDKKLKLPPEKLADSSIPLKDVARMSMPIENAL
ncbi:NAD(P)/FAD-dependent oxidoreductase [Hyphomicrobium sp. MC1]|uniref:NAD(P)/FAD-dependent oxidoreductase n=1 Tax=Hyphomicrobium sp. (strain MC1) TaxID=717785 RepID=UPI000213EF90|nr:FAD-dependent oxidoreductase [Hyphomicrobium sp. MC1]CCB65456.1 FAD-dependent pyridine nucleotide-disulphide oxidoreductase [Hyphomicrobium sp. MC1]